MTRNEMIKEVAQKVEMTQKDVKAVMDALQEVVLETLPGDEVKLMDGMTVQAVYKEAHVGRNPATGEMIEIAGKYAPKAHFTQSFKTAINK